jgi:hypothetical protein
MTPQTAHPASKFPASRRHDQICTLTYVQWLTAHDAAFAAFRREFNAQGIDVDVELPVDDSGTLHCKVVGVFEIREFLGPRKNLWQLEASARVGWTVAAHRRTSAPA